MKHAYYSLLFRNILSVRKSHVLNVREVILSRMGFANDDNPDRAYISDVDNDARTVRFMVRLGIFVQKY